MFVSLSLSPTSFGGEYTQASDCRSVSLILKREDDAGEEILGRLGRVQDSLSRLWYALERQQSLRSKGSDAHANSRESSDRLVMRVTASSSRMKVCVGKVERQHLLVRSLICMTSLASH